MSSPEIADRHSFHGRERELAAIADGFARTDVVTLIGPGGAGKTRLARVHVERSADRLIGFCDLSAARSADDFIGVVAAALGAAASASDREAALEQIARVLANRSPGLLVLDNLETVEGVSALVAALAGRGARLLATSRHRVTPGGEREIEVGPLGAGEAMALFADRARLVAPEIVIDASAEALVERLEGSPLAIELAAARAHVLAPATLLERLSRSLAALKGNAPSLPPRHRSLRAVVEGSWELSSDADRRALAALSVFRGGFDLTAAEAALGDDAADRIESLLDSSLAYRVADRGQVRFALYESVRELATEKLAAEPGAREAAEQRHANYFHALAASLAEGASNLEERALSAQSRDADNLIAAFRHSPYAAIAHGGLLHRLVPADAHLAELEAARARLRRDETEARAELELAITRAVRRFGRAERAVAVGRLALDLATESGRDRLVADANYILCVALYDAGLLDEARAHGERAVTIAERCGSTAILARSLDQLGFCALDANDFGLATRCAERVLAIARENGFRLVESFAENLLAGVSRRQGDLALSESHLHRAISLVEKLGLPTQHNILLGNLGKVLLYAGDLDGATAALEEALAISRRWGQRRTESAHLANLATVFADAGRLTEARARAAHAEEVARGVQHRRIAFQAAILLGSIALIEGRASDARGDFARALCAAGELGSAPSAVAARGGEAAALALEGDVAAGLELVAASRPAASEVGGAELALFEAGAAIVYRCRARQATARGEAEAAASASRDAEASLAVAEARAASSAEVRLLHRAARELDLARERRPLPASQATGPFELVTRSGITGASALPADADLAFDAVERRAVVDGAKVIDLRKKPIAARLLEVVLGEPGASFDKARLYREVWHGAFRSESQVAAVYKAVDRLARLLDDDPRRFLRWDEAGALVVAARTPTLLRVPPER